MQSVLRIREVLTDALQRLGESSNAAPAMRAMRAACREDLDQSGDGYSHDLSIGSGRLRALFNARITFLYPIDLEEDLASIIPPRFNDVLDEADVKPRLVRPRR